MNKIGTFLNWIWKWICDWDWFTIKVIFIAAVIVTTCITLITYSAVYMDNKINTADWHIISYSQTGEILNEYTLTNTYLNKTSWTGVIKFKDENGTTIYLKTDYKIEKSKVE